MALFIAHRGLSRDVPENSIPAFERALEAADGIELDVQLARCGTPVVAHDLDLARLYGRPERVEDLTAAELGRLVPIDDYDADPGRLYIPTLEEVLRLLPDDFFLNVEIKAPKVRPHTPTRALAEVLAETGHDPLVSSFNPIELARLALYRPGSRLALLYSSQQGYPLRQGMAANLLRGANFEAIHPDWKLVSPALVERAHDRGWNVNVWTVNDPCRAAWLLEEGVDALISDVPDELIKHVG